VQDVGIGEVVCGGDAGGGFVDVPGVLAVGEDVVCVGDKILTEAEYLATCAVVDPIGPGAQVNVAAANSNESNAVVTSNTVLFRCIDPDPEVAELSIIKTPDIDFVGIGGTINYEILVTNTGTETLHAVVVRDLFQGTTDPVCATEILLPTESMICSSALDITPGIHDGICTLGGIVRNVAVVSALDPDDVETDIFAAEATVELDDCLHIGLPPVFEPF
jgi:uncharacterized repeat protein (TIGR01451 family)